MKMPAFVPRLLPLLIAASLLPVTASAEDASPLMTIVVTGTPEAVAPFGVEVENLQSLRPATSDSASLLRDVPGVSLYGSGGVSRPPAMHGPADPRARGPLPAPPPAPRRSRISPRPVSTPSRFLPGSRR